MNDILSKILTCKAERLAAQKRKLPLADVEREARMMPMPRFNFLQTLSHPAVHGMHVIAEVKKASPSKGVIREDFNPLEIAKVYAQNGASALSVLTEQDFFQGSDVYLQSISAQVALPTLRKDFLVEAYPIYEAKILGASAFLLIVACLEDAALRELIALGNDLGLTPLVEVHDEAETERALNAKASLIGINNRDLRTFQISLDTTFRLRKQIPQNIPVISESGIFTRNDMMRLQSEGLQAALVGESLMREEDIGAKLRELLGLPQ